MRPARRSEGPEFLQLRDCRKVAQPGSVAAPWRAEQAGDLGDSRVARFDVAPGGAR